MFGDPDLELRVVHEGEGGFGRARDPAVAALEIDGVAVIDAALLAPGKVQVEQGRGRCGAEALGAGKEGVFPDGAGDEAGAALAGAALAGAVLALECPLAECVRVRRGGDLGVAKEGGAAALEGAAAPFDFAFGLRGGCDGVGDAEGSQSALGFAPWVAAVGAGTGAGKAGCISADGPGDAVFCKGAAEVAEVVPGGAGGDETARSVAAGMVVDGEEEDLLLRRGPPLVDGAAVRPGRADGSPAKTTEEAHAGACRREEMRQVSLEQGLHAGAGPDQAGETLAPIGHEWKTVLIRFLDTKELRKAGRQERKSFRAFFQPSCLPKSPLFALCQATG